MNEALVLVSRSLAAARNIFRAAQDQSRLKVLVISVFCACWLAGMFFLFLGFFRWLQSLAGAGVVLIPRLFTLFFMGIGGMLVLSGAITGYGALFQSRETRMLLSLPVPLRRLLYYKFLEASVLSSWAFFFIIVPFIAAYAVFKGMGAMIAVWTVSYSVPFVMLCSGTGVMIMLVITRFVPVGRPRWILGLLALLSLITAVLVFSAGFKDKAMSAALPLADLIPGLRLANHPLSPSLWLAEGILSMTRGDHLRGVMLWCVLATNAALLGLLAGEVGHRLFRGAWHRADALDRSRETRRPVLLGGLLDALPLGRGDLRAFLEKDIRIFLREPSQWSQGLVFFGLLGFYFFNIRSFGYGSLEPVWRNLIAFLNVFSLSAVMSSLASRFCYPQMSLEGQGIWIVGLAPTSMPRIMSVKFILSAVTLMATGGTLCWVSTRMLGLEAPIRMLSIILILFLAMSLSALSVGLGAVFLETEVKPPSAIISGFGGTLNLILNLVVMILTVAPVALTIRYAPENVLRSRIVLLAVWSAAVTLVATMTPLLIARRRLLRRDY
ncbi:MAG: hypothetical protein U1F77_04380 [Kiritimatiellia bacterium]